MRFHYLTCISLAIGFVFSECFFIFPPVDGRSRPSALQVPATGKGISRGHLVFQRNETDSAWRGHEMTPRAARIETPLRALFGSSLLLMPSTPAYAIQDAFAFESTMRKYFPKALPTSAISTKIRSALAARKFTRYNTLYGTSISPDEINSKPKESLSVVLEEYLSKYSGIYAMGGLGGLPLQGVRGMEEFLSHCPRRGKVFILFGPNIGISDNGIVGKIERLGQTRLSECCDPGLNTFQTIQAHIRLEKEREAAEAAAAREAAIRAAEEAAAAERARLEAEAAAEEAAKLAAKRKMPSRFGKREQEAPLSKVEVVTKVEIDPKPENKAPPPKETPRHYNALDNQMEFVLTNLRKYVDTTEAARVSKPAMPAFVTLQMFKLGQSMIMEQLEACLSDQARKEDIQEVVLLGGIIVNRGQMLGSIEPREDYFQPLVFESYNGEEDAEGNLEGIDLFEATFGDLPSFLQFA